LGVYLRHIGKTHKSDALLASGAHVLSDVWTTGGVMLGLGLVLLTDIKWIDPIVAIAVGVNLAWTGLKIVRPSLGGLLDEQDETVLQNLTHALETHRSPGIIDIHHMRMIRSGRFHHVDAHLVVPEYWDIAYVHDVTHEFEKAVVKDYEFDGEIAFHLDPCKKSFCRTCSVLDCPIRLEAFQSSQPFTVKSLTRGPHPTNQVAHGYSSSQN
jgi:cation diffusion facilitator family transporter